MKMLLWEIRNSKGLSLLELEKITGIKKSTLNNIENEKTSPNLKQLEAIAKGMNIKINNLFESEYK